MFTKEQEARIRMWMLNRQFKSLSPAMAKTDAAFDVCRVALAKLVQEIDSPRHEFVQCIGDITFEPFRIEASS